MGKKIGNTLKYALWGALSIALLYFSFRGVDWKDFGAALRQCRWEDVLLSMAAGALALYVRGLRWRMQILPMDPSISRLTCWNAYNICMIVNLVLPRVGEVVRSAYVTRNSSRDASGKRRASMDKVIGTVVVDRVWDAVSLLSILVVVVGLMWKRFGDFFSETLFPGIAGKAHLWWIPVLLVLAAAGFVWLSWRLRDRGRLWGKVWDLLRGLRTGLASCLHMRHGWLFIFYTIFIWALYWLMSASILWSLQGISPEGLDPELAGAFALIDNLGPVDALFLMFAGAVSSVVPVPGGFGAFHTVVAGALSSIYGIPFGVGLVFATLSHESQVIVDIVCGAGSWLYETFFRR